MIIITITIIIIIIIIIIINCLGCARNDVDIFTDDLTNKAHNNKEV